MLPTISPARNAPRYPLPPAESSEKKLIVTTVSTASADDSRQTPERWLEMAAARPIPATTPSTVLISRSTRKSETGCVSELSPLSSTPAMVSASAAPVGSLKADSATTVWATFGRSRERTNSGIRMAGSVGASTAPISSDGRPARGRTPGARSRSPPPP